MIPGISDRKRLPRLGKIRLGEKATNVSGTPYPRKWDHFNFKDVPEVAKVYGGNCRAINIMFPVEDIDIYFEQARKAYRQSGLFCKCDDGLNATRVRVGPADGTNPKVPKGTIMDSLGEVWIAEKSLDVEVGHMFELPCNPEECPLASGEHPMCKPIGRLLFLMPDIPRFGCYEISTTSFNSMVQVNSSIAMIRALVGRISMIPLTLKLVPTTVTPHGKKTTVYTLELTIEGNWTRFLKGGQPALPAPLSALSMPPKEALDAHVPDDLMPHGGALLEEKVGGPGRGALPAPAGGAEQAPNADAELGESSPAEAAAAMFAGEEDADDVEVEFVPAALTPAAPAPRPAAPRPPDPRPAGTKTVRGKAAPKPVPSATIKKKVPPPGALF